MMRTRSVGAAGVKVPSCSYLWVVVFHTHVVPSSAGGTTLALIPPEKVAAPPRSACIRAAAFVRSAVEVPGGLNEAARSSMPIRLGAAAGEPVAVSLTLLTVERRREQYAGHGLQIAAERRGVGQVSLRAGGVAAGRRDECGDDREAPPGATMVCWHAAPPKVRALGRAGLGAGARPSWNVPPSHQMGP